MTLHHHAQTITNQYRIDLCFIHHARKHRVIAGQTGKFGTVFFKFI